MTEPRKPIDWEAVEREYRAGQLSVSEIGRMSGCSHTAIQKKSKALGWTRNLRERVREEVAARLVAEGVATGNVRETVERAAERDIQLIREHRRDIGDGRQAVRELFTELRGTTKDRDEIERAIETETQDDANGKRRTTMLKAVSLPVRAAIAANLAIALKNLVGIERTAFGMESGTPFDGDRPVEVTKIERIIIRPADPDG